MAKPITITHENEQQWLEEKQKYIGASEVASLFGYGFQSYYQLWHTKAGILEPEDLDDAVTILVGKHMESGFADVLRHVYQQDMRKSHRYLIHPQPELGLACSLDYEVREPGVGWVPCELKIMDFSSFADNFEELEMQGEYDPPLKYALQLQQQLMITGKPYGYLSVLVSNRTVHQIKMEADADVHDIIADRALKFWRSIAENQPPSPDYDTDLQLMYRTMTNIEDGREIHVHGDEWWEESMTAYAQAGAAEKAHKQIKDRLRAEILDRMGPAIRARMTGGTISAKVTERYGTPRRELRITPKRTK